MKILQINAWLGAFTNQIIDVIDREKPDFVCMQEILTSDTQNPLWPRYTMLQQIQDGTDMKATFAPTYSFLSMGVKVSLCNAVFARKVPVMSETLFTHGDYIEKQTSENFQRNIRNAQVIAFTNPDITIVNHHGFHDNNPVGNEQSLASMQTLANYLRDIKTPMILCGDLNLSPNSPALEPLLELGLTSLTRKYSVKTTLSDLFRIKGISVACDHIFISDRVEEVRFTVLDNLISDHKALLLDFKV